MTRTVILVDIADSTLPEVTPVVPVLASWVPIVYVAPPPAAPLSLLASPVSDGVLLTWTHPGGRGIEFRIERAPDVAGAPGTWIQVGQTADLRYTATTAATQVDGFWWRVRAVRNGKYSDYAGPVFQWPYASNPPVQELAITNSTITIDCRYTKFRLILDQDVNYVAFINCPPTKTVLLYVTQSGGDHLLLFPPWVRPINNVPFIASPVAGSVDIIGLDTENAGIDWALVVQQPAGGGSAFAVTAWPSPAYAAVFCTPSEAAQPSIQVTSEQVNGTAPVVCDWSRIDIFGGADFDISAMDDPAPVFSVPSGTTAYDAVQVWRVTYTDGNSRTVNTTVTIRLVRTVVANPDLAAGLLNPGFESGATGWDWGTSMAVTTSDKYEGARCAQLLTDYWGESEVINQYVADVEPGQVLTARCMIQQGSSDSGNAGGRVRIKWYTAGGVFISNAQGNLISSGSGGSWGVSQIASAVVPAGAYKARLAGMLYRNAQNRVVHCDAFSWARVS